MLVCAPSVLYGCHLEQASGPEGRGQKARVQGGPVITLLLYPLPQQAPFSGTCLGTLAKVMR